MKAVRCRILSSGRTTQLKQDCRGVSATEFAICLPLLLILALWSIEMVHYVMVRQQISQLALQVADNAARIGTQNTVQTQIDEKQINDLFTGAELQASKLDLANRGRVILSSLEVSDDPAKTQYIHWQRCFGALNYDSSYGKEGDGAGGSSIKGMGPATGMVTAFPGVPSMFVEIGYKYQPLISERIVSDDSIQEIAAMLVRDNRDTSGPGVNPVAGVTASICSS